MPEVPVRNAAPSSIIDNLDRNVLGALEIRTDRGRELCIATAFFSLDALNLIGERLKDYDRIRLLFGDDASARDRNALLTALRGRSDADLHAQREGDPLLPGLRHALEIVGSDAFEARCYTRKKFHAKAYLIDRNAYEVTAIVGSSNFTRPGLTQNIELNVELIPEQYEKLRHWFDARWEEAQQDVVTEEIEREIRRQVDLYEPYMLYAKALRLWGDHVQGGKPREAESVLVPELDAHQLEGYRRALRIADRHNGVMVCDGVGLGKSYIALALVEHWAKGLGGSDPGNVLLIAPKSILKSSWEGYLKRYLKRLSGQFGKVQAIAMTDLGFEPANREILDQDDLLSQKQMMVEQLTEWADAIVIDESHNFRTTGTNRYKNLFQVIEAARGRRKKVVLLTATPINTAYQDLTAQLALITHEHGLLGGYTLRQIRSYAKSLDKGEDGSVEEGQRSLELFKTPSESLNDVMESVIIQRSRQTCRKLAVAAKKPLHFPKRKAPECLEVQYAGVQGGYRDLVELADQRFRPGVHLIDLMKKEVERVEKAETKNKEAQLASVLDKLNKSSKGLKLSAFLIEQYRLPGSPRAKKTYRSEVHLAKLVFANALKQLESSPVAFQGIIQSLGTGLLGRLSQVFGDNVGDVVEEHSGWVRTKLFRREVDEEYAADERDEEELESGPEAGEESDAWLEQVIRQRGLQKKLADFCDGEFDTERWKRDILEDLRFLREIHAATVEARSHPDPKLDRVVEVVRRATRVDPVTGEPAKVLVFTQSQRTAEYLEMELRERLAHLNVARIDSRVSSTRASILHAFCPNYNEPPKQWSPSVPERIDVLISTDVLAEGVNLQEAHAVLNYDIHWNPVRLIQRIGRIDRRLDPDKTPHDHMFDIYNVLPPKEIEVIINLVGTIENRTIAISRTVGLDLSFFKPTDPAGNLREFNSDQEKWEALYEGDVTPFDQAIEDYVALTHPDNARLLARIDEIPDGATGVWVGAPRDGVFACYVMSAKDEATEADRKRFKEVIGQPVLAVRWEGGGFELDPPRVLGILRDTQPGEKSGLPSGDGLVRQSLRAIRDRVRQQFCDVGGAGLPNTVVPRLKCVIELKEKE